jgi:hypothetical protein
MGVGQAAELSGMHQRLREGWGDRPELLLTLSRDLERYKGCEKEWGKKPNSHRSCQCCGSLLAEILD